MEDEVEDDLSDAFEDEEIEDIVESDTNPVANTDVVNEIWQDLRQLLTEHQAGDACCHQMFLSCSCRFSYGCSQTDKMSNMQTCIVIAFVVPS